MATALRMLSRRGMSEAEIRGKLSNKGFAEGQASQAVARLRDLGLVDDAKLCAQLVRSFREERGYGSAKIAWTLRARLFPPVLVEETLRELTSGEEERVAASVALRKKFRRGIPPGRDAAAKAYRFLAGRGFSPETCRAAVRELALDFQEGEG